MYDFQILSQKTQMLPLWPLLKQLNGAVTEPYLDSILDEMISHGYRMVCMYDQGRCVAVSGIWVSVKIYSGRYLEMDNVVVDDAYRSKGIGQILTEYVTALAIREGCRTMMLDAYLENSKAHTFYERMGFVKKGYHFIKSLNA